MVNIVIIPGTNLEVVKQLYSFLESKQCGLVPYVIVQNEMNIPSLRLLRCDNFESLEHGITVRQMNIVISFNPHFPLEEKEQFIIFSGNSNSKVSRTGKTYDLSKEEAFQSFLDIVYHNSLGVAVRQPNNRIILMTGILNRNLPMIDFESQPVVTSTKPTVKPMCNWTSSEGLHNMWKKMMKNDGWDNYTMDSRRGQYSMVINAPTERVDPSKMMYFAMEPHMDKSPQFGEIYNAIKQVRPLFFGSHEHHLNNVEWHLSLSREELVNRTFEKIEEHTLTSIISDKNYDPGHILRIALLRELDKRAWEGTLPFKLRIYGSCKSLGFKNYYGELPPNQKDEGLFKYKYHLNAENNSINNYITEKFTDSLLSECLTFYWGAPNISKYYHPSTFVELEMNNIEESIQKITQTIHTNQWELRIQKIREERLKPLNQYNTFNRIQHILRFYECRAFIQMTQKEDMELDSIKSVAQALHSSSFHNVHFAIYHPQAAFTHVQLWKIGAEENKFILFVSEKNEDKVKMLYNDLLLSNLSARGEEEVEGDIIILKGHSDSYMISPKACKVLFDYVVKNQHIMFQMANLEELARQNKIYVSLIN